MASASASCVRVCCCVVVELHSSPPWWFQSCVFRSFRRRAFAWFFSRLCEERHIVVCSLSEWFVLVFFCVHHIDATSALMADYMFGQ